MKNALTIDIEDYFHVAAFERFIPRSEWRNHPLRVEESTARVLDLLDEHGTKGTFFILGWVAEHRPSIVRAIRDRNHEIACHGYAHDLIYRLEPEIFRKDIRRARALLEDICGERVIGYRAPSFSITEQSLWALDILIEEGFLYDSSIYPVVHDLYGMPHWNPFPHEITRSSGVLREFPLTTLGISMFNRTWRFPVAGGGYLRLLPVWFLKKAFRRINARDGQPAVLYFHPWEFDPEQPRIKASLKSRFRHYQNLHKTKSKVAQMLSSFEFSPMSEVLGAE